MTPPALELARLLDKVRDAEERYRTLFNSSSDTLTVLSPDGTVVEVNQRWGETLKIDPQTMVGRNIRDFAPPGKAEANFEAYTRSIEGRAQALELAPLLRSDGQIIYMEFSTRRIVLDGKPMALATGRDVTQRVKSAQALELADERYRTLVERIPDVIWSCDESGRILFITPNVEWVIGFTPAEMMEAGIDRRCCQTDPEDEPMVRAAFQALLSSGVRFDIEYRRKRKDGSWQWVRNRVFSDGVRDGVRQFEGWMTDITEKRKLEDAMRQSQKMEAIGLLSGGIAHDFNNLLAAILSSSHFLIDDFADGDPRRADAIEIKLAAERAAALTRQLLTFSRRQVVDPQSLDLNATIGGIQKMVTRLIGETIECSFLPAEALACVRADPGQLEQVIMNLVVNARDAMPAGGQVTIATANVELDPAAAALIPAPAGTYVMMAISDTGTGMDTETKRRLFEPFFTTKEIGKGTGLGLSTCYGIVKQGGGFITVDSERGVGSVFKVFLPATLQESIANRSAQAASIVPSGNETVLVIEDDERVRAAVARILGDRGYRLVVARNGAEALAAVAANPGQIDLVLSDVIMPGLNGPDVVSRLREGFAGLKALFMSGYTDHSLLHEGELKSGINFIQKPFSPEALARRVRQVLDQRIRDGG